MDSYLNFSCKSIRMGGNNRRLTYLVNCLSTGR